MGLVRVYIKNHENQVSLLEKRVMVWKGENQNEPWSVSLELKIPVQTHDLQYI